MKEILHPTNLKIVNNISVYLHYQVLRKCGYHRYSGIVEVCECEPFGIPPVLSLYKKRLKIDNISSTFLLLVPYLIFDLLLLYCTYILINIRSVYTKTFRKKTLYTKNMMGDCRVMGL